MKVWAEGGIFSMLVSGKISLTVEIYYADKSQTQFACTGGLSESVQLLKPV